MDTVRRVEYYYARVGNRPGEGRRLLEHLSERGVNLLAFTAFPLGDAEVQLDFVPEDAAQLCEAADDARVPLVGPRNAFLVQGDDRIGALHEIHLKLANANVNIRASNGITCNGRYGFLLWVKLEDYEAAARALDLDP